jgi:phosphonate transport system substrate-binding protein
MENSAIRVRPAGFAVCPHDAAAAAVAWRTFHEHLNERFSLRTSFLALDQFPPFQDALDRGDFAIAFLNPSHYVRARDQQGYIAIARPADSLEIARLITLRTRACNIISEGAVACVDVHMTTAALHSLQARGVQLTPTFVESYAAVVEAVRQGDTPYGLVYGNYLGDSLTDASAVQIALAQVVHLPHVLAVHPTLASHIPELQAFFFDSLDAFTLSLDLGISSWEPVPETEYEASRSDATIVDTFEEMPAGR